MKTFVPHAAFGRLADVAGFEAAGRVPSFTGPGAFGVFATDGRAGEPLHRDDIDQWPIAGPPSEDSDRDGLPDRRELCAGLESKDPDDGNRAARNGCTEREDHLNRLAASDAAAANRRKPLSA